MNIKQISENFSRPESEFGYRADGRIEWCCKHGVGHTVWFPKESNVLHGCDGCCKELVRNMKE